MRTDNVRTQFLALICLLVTASPTLAGADDEAYTHLIDSSPSEDVVSTSDISFSADDHEALIAQQTIAPISNPNKFEKQALKRKHKAEIRALHRRFQDDLHRLELRQEDAIKALETGR